MKLLKAKTHILVPLQLERFGLIYTRLFVVLLIAFGGGTRQGSLSDVLVELASLPLLFWAVASIKVSQLSRCQEVSIACICAILAVPLIQLVPLPPSLWVDLPGREIAVNTYSATKTALPWLGISLDPIATWQSFLSLLPATALFLTTISFTSNERRLLIKTALIVVAISIPLDLMQQMGGPTSPFRFFVFTNPDRAVGFFANANHNAALLYSCIPFITLFAVQSALAGRRVSVFIAGAFFFAVFLGLASTHSRAGLALGFVASAFSSVMVYRLAPPMLRSRMLKYGIMVNLLALFVAFQFGFSSLSQRVEHEDLLQNIRWPIAQVTFEAAKDFSPFGSGLGTFQPVYERYAPSTLAMPEYVNHAHNDWLELLLEVGVPGFAVIAASLLVYLWICIRVWFLNSEHEISERMLAQAGSIVVSLLLVHSVLDYPLRTICMSSLMALSWSCMLTLGTPEPRKCREFGRPAPDPAK